MWGLGLDDGVGSVVVARGVGRQPLTSSWACRTCYLTTAARLNVNGRVQKAAFSLFSGVRQFHALRRCVGAGRGYFDTGSLSRISSDPYT